MQDWLLALQLIVLQGLLKIGLRFLGLGELLLKIGLRFLGLGELLLKKLIGLGLSARLILCDWLLKKLIVLRGCE